MFRAFLLISLLSTLTASEDDVITLLKKLDKDPKNKTLMLSLSETYKSLRLLDSSIKWIEKIVALGGTNDELWVSYITLGKLYEEKKEDEKAHANYIKAIEMNPQRKEPFHRLARLFRMKGKNDLCTFYALQGKNLPSLEQDEVYSNLLDEELSIAAYYTPQKEQGLHAINRLLLNKSAPIYLKSEAMNNLRYYIKSLQATFLPLQVTAPQINEKENYYAINPSIQKIDTGYELICRMVNYEKVNEEHNQALYSRDPQNKSIVTRNFFVKLDKEFNLVSEQEILDQSHYPKFPWLIEGCEDCRLIHFQDDDYFTCAITDANASHTAQVALGRLTKETTTCEVTPLKGPNPTRAEKNWLPFLHNNAIHTIYSYDPLTILKPDLTTGECLKVIETTSPFDGSRFRGSAGPIPFEDGYLVIIHEMTFAGKYYYYHRFVFMDKDFQITKLSPSFYFKVLGVEYCSGMTLDHDEKNVILTVGIEDRQACLASISIEDVKNQLSIK